MVLSEIKKILVYIIIYFIFILLQTSFLISFGVLGIIFNLIIISVIAYNSLEDSKKISGLFNAIIGGIFLDFFSSSFFFGFFTLILLVIAMLIKFVLRKYVRIPTIF